MHVRRVDRRRRPAGRGPGGSRASGPATSSPSRCRLDRLRHRLRGGVRAGAVATGLNTRLGPREVTRSSNGRQPAVVSASRPDGGDSRGPCARSTARRRPRRGRADDPGGHHLDERDDGLPKGAWFDHDGLAAAVSYRRGMAAPFDRRLVGDAVRPRRLHGQALGAAGLGHHPRAHPDAVDGATRWSVSWSTSASPSAGGGADPVGQARRTARRSATADLRPPPLPQRHRARPARAGRAHRVERSGARSSSATR